MRKLVKAGICGMAAVMLFAAGCSSKDAEQATEGSQVESSAEAEETVGETEPYVEEGSITLGEYKGIPVNAIKVEVTEEEVEASIQQVLNANAEYLEVAREAQLGDMVNMDYKGLLDGEAFEGGTAEGSDLILGSGDFIDGFEDGLVGLKKGDKKSLDLTFPEQYHSEELAGKAVVFEVTVNAVKERTVPELTDEFVAKVSPEDSTVEEFRERAYQFLFDQKQYASDGQRDTDIVNAIIESSEIVCATKDVDEAYELQFQSVSNMIASYGLDLATYAALTGTDEAGVKAQVRETAKVMVQQEMVLKEIAKLENITATEDDYNELAQDYGFENKDAMIQTGNVTKEMVEDTALMANVLEFLAENADVTEITQEEALAALEAEAAKNAETEILADPEVAEDTEAETETEETKAQ